MCERVKLTGELHCKHMLLGIIEYTFRWFSAVFYLQDMQKIVYISDVSGCACDFLNYTCTPESTQDL